MNPLDREGRNEAWRAFNEYRRSIDTRALYMSRLEISPDADREKLLFLLRNPVMFDDMVRDDVELAGGEHVATYHVVAADPFRILVLFRVHDWSDEAREPVVEALRFGGVFLVTETVHMRDRGNWERAVYRPDKTPPELHLDTPDT